MGVDGFFVCGLEFSTPIINDRRNEWSDHRPVTLEVVFPKQGME